MSLEQGLESYSSLEQQFAARKRRLIEAVAYGKGKTALPADWEETREKRLKLVQFDYFKFAVTYFPQWFEFPFTRKHRKMIADALRSDNMLAMYAAPRRFGKTRLFRVFKIFCACTGAKHFYGKASDTIDLVIKDYRHVRAILKYNPKIVSDYGHLISDEWDTSHSFFVPPHAHNEDGTLFAAYSYTVTARGELGPEDRPDFFEFDDFEDFSTSINPDISRSKLEVIERDFMPALREKASGVYLGNNSRTTCVINLLVMMSEQDRLALHPAIELNIVDGWDEENNRPLWYERYPYKSEEQMRLALKLSVSVWKAEIRQRPVPPEGIRFLLAHWITYKDLPKGELVGKIMCDPAYGTKSDFKVIAVMLYSFKLRKFLVPGVFCRRCGWEEYFLAMYDFHRRYRDLVPDIMWEENFGQAQFLEFQKIYTSTKKLPPLPITFKSVKGDKTSFRIPVLEAPYSLGNILWHVDFLKTVDGIEAQSQIIGFEGKDNGRVDFPDALSSCYDELFMFSLQESLSSSQEYYHSGPRRTHSRR